MGFLELKKAPKKVSGTEIPSQRKRRARIVVKGTAALEPAPHKKRFNVKNAEKMNLYGRKVEGRRGRKYE